MKRRIPIQGLMVLALITGFMVSPLFSGLTYGQKAHHENIEIGIYAGVYGHTDGNAGLGWVVSVYNSGNNTVNVTYEIRWANLRGAPVRSEEGTFNVNPHMVVQFVGIDWVHPPFPVLRITISVQTQNVTVSRSGIEVFPFVIFPAKL